MKVTMYNNSEENHQYKVIELDFNTGNFRRKALKINETKIRVKQGIFCEINGSPVLNIEKLNDLLKDMNELRESKGLKGTFKLLKNDTVNRPYYVEFEKEAA